MNKQARIAIVIVVAVAAIIFFQQQAAKKAQEEAAASAAAASPSAAKSVAPVKLGPGPRDYLVAKANLNPAEMQYVTTSVVEVRTIPDSIPVPDDTIAVRTWEQIKDEELASPITAGEIILRTRFSRRTAGDVQRKLRDVIPINYRAITLDVDAITGTTGFINQGDIVDILATYMSGGRQLTRIIQQNVEVLAKGSEYRTVTRPTAEKVVRGDAGGGILFTLKVTPQMALKLAHIIDERGFNRFRLVMKNRDDRQEFRTPGVLLKEVITDQTRPQVSKELSEADQAAEIEVLRGVGSARESGQELAGPIPGIEGQVASAPGGAKAGAEAKGEVPAPPPEPAAGGGR